MHKLHYVCAPDLLSQAYRIIIEFHCALCSVYKGANGAMWYWSSSIQVAISDNSFFSVTFYNARMCHFFLTFQHLRRLIEMMVLPLMTTLLENLESDFIDIPWHELIWHGSLYGCFSENLFLLNLFIFEVFMRFLRNLWCSIDKCQF